jgi:DNA-directed RNA polymerase specialized sigma24 family protein
MDEMSPPPGQVPGVVTRAAAGDRAAVVELLDRYRARLRRMVALRLGPRVRGRVDASDVIQEALNRMGPLDREILVLRHYQQMTNGDAAAALGLTFKAASKRYTGALERLEKILGALPGDTRGQEP